VAARSLTRGECVHTPRATHSWRLRLFCITTTRRTFALFPRTVLFMRVATCCPLLGRYYLRCSWAMVLGYAIHLPHTLFNTPPRTYPRNCSRRLYVRICAHMVVLRTAVSPLRSAGLVLQWGVGGKHQAWCAACRTVVLPHLADLPRCSVSCRAAYRMFTHCHQPRISPPCTRCWSRMAAPSLPLPRGCHADLRVVPLSRCALLLAAGV